MKPSKWFHFRMFALLLIAYVVLTGGLFVYSSNHFSYSERMEVDHGLTAQLWVKPTTRRWYLPLLFYWIQRGGPFDLTILLRDDVKQYQSVDLTDIVLEYADGERVHHQEPWRWTFELTNAARSVVQGELPGIVRRHSDVTVSVYGTLTTVDGDRRPFSVSEAFGARTKWSVFTLWIALFFAPSG